MTPPRTLDELLHDFDNIKVVDVDAAIEANIWAKRFREFLDKRDLAGKITALKFLIMTQSAHKALGNNTSTTKETNNNSKSSKKQAALRKELAPLFLSVGSAFFNAEESEDLLSLSNQVLLESLMEMTSRLREGKALRDEDVANVMRARKDINVMQNGLEPKFMKFLSVQSNTPMACLLSIL